MERKDLRATYKKAYWRVLKAVFFIPLIVTLVLSILGLITLIAKRDGNFYFLVFTIIFMSILNIIFIIQNNVNFAYDYVVNENGFRLFGVNLFGKKQVKTFEAKDIQFIEWKERKKDFDKLTIHLHDDTTLTYEIIPETIDETFQEKLMADFQMKIDMPSTTKLIN